MPGLDGFRLAGYTREHPPAGLPSDLVAVLGPAGPPSAVSPRWAVNVRVTDADATAERARALGGTVLLGPLDTPGLRSAVIADPQGALTAVSAPAGG